MPRPLTKSCSNRSHGRTSCSAVRLCSQGWLCNKSATRAEPSNGARIAIEESGGSRACFWSNGKWPTLDVNHKQDKHRTANIILARMDSISNSGSVCKNYKTARKSHVIQLGLQSDLSNWGLEDHDHEPFPCWTTKLNDDARNGAENWWFYY